MDFRSDAEKNAEQKAGQPLESPLEEYAQSIVDAFATYDGNSISSDNQTKAKVRPIGEELDDDEKQLQVFHRACVLAKPRGIYIDTTTMERFWDGCGGWMR